MKRTAGCLWLCWVALLWTGCGPRLIRPAEGLAIEDAPATLDWSSYSLLLQHIVVGDKIDTTELLKHRPLLDRTLAMVSRLGPPSHRGTSEERDDRLAYAINCHNAAVLGSILALVDGDHVLASLPWNFDRRFQFLVEGKPRTVAALREQAVAMGQGDWRIRLALYSGRLDGPPLNRRPFLGNLLDAQLDAATRAALKSEQVVRLDFGERKQLLLWRGLFNIRRSLIKDYERRLRTANATFLSVLLEWSDPFRRETLNSAVGYPVVAMPVDRRFNALPLPISAEQ